MVFDQFKTFVGKTVAKETGKNIVASTGSVASTKSLFAQIMAETGKMLNDEKEWQCPCGHKFKAGGEWVACAPIHCEVPSCPNPKYYIDGPGRALLEANPSGVKLEEVKDNPKISPSSGKGGVGSRFK